MAKVLDKQKPFATIGGRPGIVYKQDGAAFDGSGEYVGEWDAVTGDKPKPKPRSKTRAKAKPETSSEKTEAKTGIEFDVTIGG